MRPALKRKIRALLLICLASCLAGVIYQLIDEEKADINSIMIGFPLGLVFGILELFLFPRVGHRFRKWSFSKMLLFKSIFYTMVIFLITVGLAVVAGLLEGKKWSDLHGFLASVPQIVLVVYTLFMYGLLIFFLQVNQLLGQGVLWKFITGKYHHPREEVRIFMFLDMKSSTTIAEQLGHARFYSLLNELFHEISSPILQTKAQIYQYVGDEVVLTWEMEDGIEQGNCLRLFFLYRGILQQKADDYYTRFGVRPEFKAGLHFGKVVCAQIGELKREIVYNGDVLNTTSRIRNECNKYQRDCLVSGLLRLRLQHIHGFNWERIEKVMLRGKEKEIELFGVTFA